MSYLNLLKLKLVDERNSMYYTTKPVKVKEKLECSCNSSKTTSNTTGVKEDVKSGKKTIILWKETDFM